MLQQKSLHRSRYWSEFHCGYLTSLTGPQKMRRARSLEERKKRHKVHSDVKCRTKDKSPYGDEAGTLKI